MRRPGRAIVAAGVVSALLALAGCTNGSSNASPEPDGSSTVPPTTAFVQQEFVAAHAVELFVAFQQAIGERFEIDGDSDVIADLSAGEFELDERLAFARERGLLGYYAVDFVAGDREEFWGLTSQVFETAEGATAMWGRFANYETISVSDAERIDESRAEFGGGREGGVYVDTYLYEDGTRTLAMRGSVVDGNVLHHVVALIDVPPGQVYDGFESLRRALSAVSGVLRAAYDQA